MKRLRRICVGITISLLVALLAGQVAFAQEGGDEAGQGDSGQASEWGEILDEHGAIQLDQLTYAGSVSSQPGWMSLRIGENIQVQLNAKFEQYITASGQVLMLPSPGTFVMMANALSNPSGDYIDDSLGTYTNGWFASTQISEPATAAGRASDVISSALLTGDFDLFSDPVAFYQHILSGGSDAASWSSLDAFSSLMSLSWQTRFPVVAMLLFESCTTVPEGCTELGEELIEQLQSELSQTNHEGDPSGSGSVLEAPEDCPPARIESQAIQVSSLAPQGAGGKLEPEAPIVVGQDQERRGVDIQAQVQVPPIIYTWYEAVPYLELVCVESASQPGAGCPGPAERYDNPGWDPNQVGHPGWHEATLIRIECIQHVETFVDPIASVTVQLSLADHSRQYINSHLAQVYPDMQLKQPDFSFVYGGPGTVANDWVTWQQLITNIPLADPGLWLVQVSGVTAGTPVSAGRSFSAGLGSFAVDTIRVSLIQP